jgi:hypothetical protein
MGPPLETVTPRDLLRGLTKTRERFLSTGRLATERIEAFMPIFEALNWAAALDARIADSEGWAWRERVRDAEVVAGFRYARHRAHHQWASVLYVTSGASLPAPLPAPLFEWRWRRDLPVGRDERGREEYDAHLADVPARYTLDTLRAVFETAIQDLLEVR